MTDPVGVTADPRPVLMMGDEPEDEPSAKLGRYLFQFESFNAWVNRAQRAWKMAGVRSDDTVCIDAIGRICRIGRDFMAARDQGRFPVRVYMMRDDL